MYGERCNGRNRGKTTRISRPTRGKAKRKKVATSNKQKRSELTKKRANRQKEVEAARFQQAVADGRVANGVIMPQGAVAANLDAQSANNSGAAPRLYYEDLNFDCRDCGNRETWRATQQKWWYEVAKGNLYSTAARCRTCRQNHRRKLDEQRARSQQKTRKTS